MPVKAPYLPYDRLRDIARNFLDKHHNPCSIPVPIESIVEFDFDIDIVPMPGMHAAFDIDSMISQDLTEIRVDQYVFESRPGRYRFSLAHELAHRILHADVYAQIAFRDLASWKHVLTTAIPEREYRLLEYQASSFAGLVLVPEDELLSRFDAAVATAEKHGLSLRADSDLARDSVAGYLAEEFVVSSAVVTRRLEFDKLWDKLK